MAGKKKPATVEEEHKGESTFVSPQQSQRSSDSEEEAKHTKKSRGRKPKPASEEEVANDIKSKKGKDPAAPPRVPSKYNIFVKMFGKQIIEDHGEEVANHDRMQIIADKFKKIDDKQEKAIEK